MAGRTYSLEPVEVPTVDTPFRKITTKIPVPESIPVLETLRKYEPLSMTGQPLVVWDRAEGCQVYDKYGNMWLDWSSGVLVTNAGHGRREIRDAIVKQAEHGLLHSYCFPCEPRARLAEKLVSMGPEKFGKAFILTTGSETTECAIKLARTRGEKVGGKEKIGIVTFEGAFHGRTLGSQMAGGSPALKEWIVNIDPDFHQVVFPGDYRCEDRSFAVFERTLAEKGVTPDRVAGVMSETHQGGGASFMPKEYAQELAAWCEKHDVVLIFDEVQAGFGRTGTMFGFEHYGVVPDLICCGKGISSSLPLSAVIGRADILDQYAPGSMTSTHTGNPICSVAALASLEIIERERLHENAARMGEVLHAELAKIEQAHEEVVGTVHGKGLVAGMHIVQKGSTEPDGDLAFQIIDGAVKKGLLFFSPVGTGGATVKIAPPLCITEEAVRDGAAALAEAFDEACG